MFSVLRRFLTGVLRVVAVPLLALMGCDEGHVAGAPDMSAAIVQARDPVIDVRTRGARGDGVADDTDALQASVDAIGPGGVVRVPPGVYRVRVADHNGVLGVRLPSHMTLELMPGAVLQAIPTAAEMYNVLLVQDVVDVTIRGGTLRRRSRSAPRNGW